MKGMLFPINDASADAACTLSAEAGALKRWLPLASSASPVRASAPPPTAVRDSEKGAEGTGKEAGAT